MSQWWENQASELLSRGYTAPEILEEEQVYRKELFRRGFSGAEIDDFFGVKTFDSEGPRKFFEENIQRNLASKQQEESTAIDLRPSHVRHAESFLDALEAGFQMSVLGLWKRGTLPDIEVTKEDGLFYNIASQVGTLAGDFPAMVLGGGVGKVAGGLLGGRFGGKPGLAIGAAIGEGAGAFAVPAAMRKWLMDSYEKGSVNSFEEFWERLSGVFIEASKGAVLGGATAGIGRFTQGALTKGLEKPISKFGLTSSGQSLIKKGILTETSVGTAGMLLSEVGAMTVLGRALEGQMPEPEDFLESAIMIAGFHAVPKVTNKMTTPLRELYAKYAIKGEEVVEASLKSPKVKEEMLAKDTDVDKVGEEITGTRIPVEEPAKPLIEAKQADETVPEAPPRKNADGSDRIDLADFAGGKGEKKKRVPTWSEIYAHFVDRYDPIKKATEFLDEQREKARKEAGLAPSENPYVLTSLYEGYKAKALYVIDRGTLDYHTNLKNGESLKEILKPYEGQERDVLRDLVARRVVELNDRKKPVKAFGETYKGRTHEEILAEARLTLKENAGKYDDISRRLTDFQNRNLDYLVKSGRLSKEMRDLFVKMNEKYLPFQRVLDPEKGISKLGKAGFLKAIEGEALNIKNPFMSIVENTETLIRMAEENRAIVSLVQLSEQIPDQALMRKVSQQTSRDVTQGSPLLKENQFEVWRDGKREVWETDPLLAKSIKMMRGDLSGQHFVVKFMHGFTKLLKAGTIFTPEFILKNFLRDQSTAGAFGSRFAPWEVLWSIKDVVSKNDTYYDFLKSGGAGGTFIELSKYMDGEFFNMAEKTSLFGAVRNLVSKPAEYINVAGRIAEEATRVAEYKRVVGAGKSFAEAGFAAREVTLDFARMGMKMSQLNAITAFQNVSIQGLDKSIRAVSKAIKDPMGAGLQMAPGVAMIATASYFNWQLNHDEDWYQEINRWEKDLFWHIKAGDTIFRIPKPQEIGIAFGTMLERTLDAFFAKNPNAFKDFGETIGELAFPSMIPDAVRPITEHWANKVFFTGRPVVPMSAERLLPAYQFTDYTSDSAKVMGQLVGMLPLIRDFGPQSTPLQSPMVIENYIRGWGGQLGMYALKTLDGVLHQTGVKRDLKPAWTVADIPFVRAFVSRYPSANSQSILDFRDNERKAETVYNTVTHLLKRNDPIGAYNVQLQYQQELVRLKDVKEALTNVGHAIQLTYQDETMSPSDKRQIIDSLYFQMIEMAKHGNLRALEMRKALSGQ